jgi:replicative DNA helicase
VSVLGSILIDPSALTLVSLLPADFFDEQNQIVFQAMLNLRDGIDQITVAHELNRMGKLEEVGVSYLSHLISQVPTSIHAAYYAGIVRDCSFNRRLISMGGQVQAQGYKNEEPDIALAKAGQMLSIIGKLVQDTKLWTPRDMATKAQDRYLKMLRQPLGLATGLKALDSKIGGLFPGEFIIVAARGGMGKTTLGLQIARNMAASLKVLFVSMEMSAASVTDKNVAALSGKRNRTIALGNYSDDTMGGINDALGILSELYLYILEGNQTTSSLRTNMERQICSHGCDVVFVDYLQRFSDRYGSSPNDRVSHISGELADIAKDFNLPLVVLCQLNREPDKREDKRPHLTDLRDSGAIEQDADLVLFIYRESYYNRNEVNNQTELIIAKDRLRGCTGYIPLAWQRDGEVYV